MGFLSRRASESSTGAATGGEFNHTSVKLLCERDDMVIGYDLGCEGTSKRPVPSFDITAHATISFSSPLEWLQGKYVTLSVYSGQKFVNRPEDKWGIGTLSVVETTEANSTVDLYLDLACTRDFAYMLNDWRRTQGTILYLAMELYLDREFTHATRGYPVKVFVIHRVSCCVHPPSAVGADGYLPEDDAD